MEGLRDRPEESYPITRAALTTEVDEYTLVYFPYMYVMTTTAAGIAAVALRLHIAIPSAAGRI